MKRSRSYKFTISRGAGTDPEEYEVAEKDLGEREVNLLVGEVINMISNLPQVAMPLLYKSIEAGKPKNRRKHLNLKEHG